jgi:hypothetical protein
MLCICPSFPQGFAYVGPVLFYWYGWLGKLIPGNSIASVFGSLAMDQVVFAPVFIASFMAILTSIEGKPEAVAAKIKADLWPAVQVCVCVCVCFCVSVPLCGRMRRYAFPILCKSVMI